MLIVDVDVQKRGEIKARVGKVSASVRRHKVLLATKGQNKKHHKLATR